MIESNMLVFGSSNCGPGRMMRSEDLEAVRLMCFALDAALSVERSVIG
jgi:hypothetical protein